MRWNSDHVSNDVIDRRGQRRGSGAAMGIVTLLMRSRFWWLGLIGLVGYGAYTFFAGTDDAHTVAGDRTSTDGAAPTDRRGNFVSFVFDDVQSTWRALKPAYARAQMVLYTDGTSTGCGYGDAATGPFYCPADRRVYLDLGFFEDLDRRLGAPGDFAQAYVIAHEVGHHVQNLAGQNRRVAEAGERARGGADGLDVRLELQADCYAGVWAHSTAERKLLEAGDIEEALRAAAAIGDDTLQKKAGRTVRPETFSHGTSAQRARWFRRGMDSGDPRSCNTFDGEL